METTNKKMGIVTLEELLSYKTVKELKEMELDMGIRIKGNPKKMDHITILSEIIKENPERLIQNMYYYELKACLDAIEGTISDEYAEVSGLLFELNRFGLIYSTECKSLPYSELHFCEELTEDFKRLIPAELERRETDGSLMVEKLALGCANFYGYTEIDNILEWLPELEERLGFSIDDEFISKALCPILSSMRIGQSYKERPFVSPFAIYNGFNPSLSYIDMRLEPKKVDLDILLGYGEMPYPEIAGVDSSKFIKYINKYGKPGMSPEQAVRSLWIFKQDDEENSVMPNLNNYFRFQEISDVEGAVDSVMRFLNTVPFWRFRGNSSKDMYNHQKPKNYGNTGRPRITMGPNLRAMGIESFEQLEEMARKGESLPPFPEELMASAKNVGRNDPCPCGSGKKYKHCCGR